MNTLALGDDVATGLGVNVTVVRGLAALSGVLLCAAVTALAGPISFIGLMVPHLIRALVGPDLKKIMPLSAVCGACVLLISDVVGRIWGRPGELESGIVTALIGGPVLFLSYERSGYALYNEKKYDLVWILQKKEKILVYRLHPAFTCHFTCLHYDGLWKYHIYAGHSPGSIKGK